MTIIPETSHCICSLQCARAGAALLPDTLTGCSLGEIVRVLHSQGGEAATLPQPAAGVLGCLDGDVLDLCLSALRHGDFEDTVLELGGRLLCLHGRR
jgi:hypothetical protein